MGVTGGSRRGEGTEPVSRRKSLRELRWLRTRGSRFLVIMRSFERAIFRDSPRHSSRMPRLYRYRYRGTVKRSRRFPRVEREPRKRRDEGSSPGKAVPANELLIRWRLDRLSSRYPTINCDSESGSCNCQWTLCIFFFLWFARFFESLKIIWEI